ncbi:cytochrome P450 6B4-like isoform X2 [Schistocerca nitens]|uniref:cytochrome P450 6B4-like isoform X2 n=1 Tax=Schistocerca nitens TaxID=7011 RepID=UPI002118075E|nr:cytochrome P450 6B4-like isoform X2 [Schistocerca nitens]
MWTALLLAAATAAAGAACWFLRRSASHWARRGLPYLRPHLLLGNAAGFALNRQTCGQVFGELYARLRGHPLAGIFLLWQPALLVRDPAIAGRVLVRDFQCFRDRGHRASDPMLQDLFFLRGDRRWRTLRDSLEPGFGPKGARHVFFLLDEMAQRLLKVLEAPAERLLELDVYDQMHRFVIDTVGTCAFGVEFESMLNYDCFVVKKTRRMTSGSLLRRIRKTLVLAVPDAARAMGVSFLRSGDADVFRWLTAEIVAHRRRHNVRRNDLMQLLMALAAKEDAGDSPQSETLRLHPPMSNLSRSCTAPYTFPGTTRLGDGALHLRPGEAPLHIPICALHRDPGYFPQPERFDPERFGPDQLARQTPYSYLPFGAGQRSCLGERLALLLMKTTLARLLSRYELFQSPRTEYPAPIDPRLLLLHPKGGLWVKISNRHWLPCD